MSILRFKSTAVICIDCSLTLPKTGCARTKAVPGPTGPSVTLKTHLTGPFAGDDVALKVQEVAVNRLHRPPDLDRCMHASDHFRRTSIQDGTSLTLLGKVLRKNLPAPPAVRQLSGDPVRRVLSVREGS